MSNNTKLFLGLACVIIGLFWNDIKERLPDIDNIIPNPTPVVDIVEPDEVTLIKVTPIAERVTDPEDRIRLAIFNDVFSKRCTSYKADAQQFNDIYVEAGKNVFGESLKGKYEGYGQDLNGLLESTLGTENHTVTEGEKVKLSKDFNGLAFALSK